MHSFSGLKPGGNHIHHLLCNHKLVYFLLECVNCFNFFIRIYGDKFLTVIYRLGICSRDAVWFLMQKSNV